MRPKRQRPETDPQLGTFFIFDEEAERLLQSCSCSLSRQQLHLVVVWGSDAEGLALRNKAGNLFQRPAVIQCVADLVRQHGFEAAAEVAERVAALVDLHPLAVVLDLGVHPVGTLFHGLVDGFTSFCLESKRRAAQVTHGFDPSRIC